MFQFALGKSFQNEDLVIKLLHVVTAQKMFCLRIWSHLLNKSFMENFIFCAVCTVAFCNNCRIL